MAVRVAVIGAGAGGLCAIRHLTARPNTFEAVAFEQGDIVGGTWIYTEKTGTDKYGLPIHSSMYTHLRTNLPKEVMAFPDFLFDSHLPSFMHHTDVLQYLKDYAQHYDLLKSIKFRTQVMRVHPEVRGDNHVQWTVSYRSVLDTENTAKVTSEKFDAVILCNGHYSVPLVPEIPGINSFNGVVTHSHDYRNNKPFENMERVVCLGAAASGSDISVEISHVAKHVVLSHNKEHLSTYLPANIDQRPGIKRVDKSRVIFHDDTECTADAIVFCTGYNYSYPFLTADCQLSIDDQNQRVTPLYKHIIHTRFPTLSFIGVCKVICPFPLFHYQVLLILSVLDKSYILPSMEDMNHEIGASFEQVIQSGKPTRYAHTLSGKQWQYNNELAALAQAEPLNPVIERLYDAVHVERKNNLLQYKSINYEIVDRDRFRKVES